MCLHSVFTGDGAQPQLHSRTNYKRHWYLHARSHLPDIARHKMSVEIIESKRVGGFLEVVLPGDAQSETIADGAVEFLN